MEMIDKTKKKNIIELIDKKTRVVYKGTEEELKMYLKEKDKYQINYLAKNTFIDLLNFQNLDVRIEPGAIIRENVSLGDKVVVLSNAVINVGSIIDDETMIDMGSVIGSGTKIGKRCHIGAGTVISGILEPASKNPVIIEDDVFIGAGAVILPGIIIKKNSIIGAGSVVTKNVEENEVVVGNPAKFLKYNNKILKEKTEINVKLR